MKNLSIKCLNSEKKDSGTLHGQFLIDYLSPGQGITIGNMLRRTLLGDLGGTSITAIRIAGVRDEFSAITGVREDVLEILLNLKGIILKSKTTDPQFGRLKIQGPAVITANSIIIPSELKFVNPNHYIATISTTNSIEIEFKFEYGKGYKLAGQTFNNKAEDFLQIDTIFMPVQKVDFRIENVYSDSNEVTERLFLEIWTNGSITPQQSISEASKLITEILNSFIETESTKEKAESFTKTLINPLDLHANVTIEELQLSVRAYNCLKRANINTIGDLLRYSPNKLKELKNFGRKSANEVFSV
jgi:DNA-directed RNA polymerase subunit alpha